MIKNEKEKYMIHCQNEYDSLHQVIVSPPDYMKITTVINETQAYYAKENINIKKARTQHDFFVKTLKNHGTEVIFLPTKPNLNEQVFTRDIGFTIHDQLFTATMEQDIRKEETNLLKNWLDNEQLDYTSFSDTTIEGGDMIIDNNHIWIGLSQRTKQTAIDYLRAQFPYLEITAIPLREDILHLDCVFNILEDKHALIYPDGMSKAAYKKIQEHYTLIEVTKEEQFKMAPNVLSVGNRKVISLPENKRVNDILKELDYHIIEVPFSEIIKSGGSFRCCTLPLYRRKS
ncbi:dimethylarginine dimethylaminohydrolase family protein [Oceanobacillus sp. CFH 90083]|uniref:dimethylarginine dimethylaminohydrolase family protein n=1 Tax=Oceanobacillus sp. CFH 90083 TaxID=2592336 RepID=UPI001D15C240|nr:arginine deiminase family protein [Oceanobacillus sp. CFH 90083]